MHIEDFLLALNQKHLKDEQVSTQEIRKLIGLCHSRYAAGEVALSLLLHPPVSDESEYTRRLIVTLAEMNPRIQGLPPALVEHLCEIIAFLEKVPDDPCTRELFANLLKNLPRASLDALSEKSFPARLFVPHLSATALQYGDRKSSKELKRRWRLLRKRITAAPSGADWPTMSDLNAARRRASSKPPSVFSKGRWLRHGRTWFAPAQFSLPALRDSSRFPYWGGSGASTLRYMEELVRRQAAELRAVRELASRVSERTGRVVLSCHNATLAAASGWAFESLRDSFTSQSRWQAFAEAVEASAEKAAAQLNMPGALGSLWECWERRIVEPKLRHALWESRIRTSYGGSGQVEWKRDLDAAGAFLHPDSLSEVLRAGRYGWHGPVSPHQRLHLPDILEWRGNRERCWQRGFIELAAIIREAQLLMDSGDLPYFVLPWIDKFFISSRREEDVVYLPSAVQWLEEQGARPLILFWEDTSHSESPSLQLALERIRGRGFACTGIGVFDRNRTERQNACEIICRSHSETRLFALRPFSDTHNPKSLDRLLTDLDYRFFQGYDSSWKDNLSFLYFGTQVFPLLSVQCDMERFSAWVVIEGVRYPFGSYFRRELRRLVLGRDDPPAGRLDQRYARWAGLC